MGIIWALTQWLMYLQGEKRDTEDTEGEGPVMMEWRWQ